ncbi:MAG: SDR family NAD(P)-dependent oxidoreductase, partial [Lentisphaerae bacterium]
MPSPERNVIITGHAGQLGTELCRQFKEAGYRIYGLDRKSAQHHYCEREKEIDLACREEVFAAVKELGLSKLDVLVNNAGSAVFTPFLERTEEEIDAVTGSNIKGLIYTTQACVPYLRKSDTPAVVNIASLYGIVSPDPRIYTDCARNSSEIYGATKAAIINMTRYLAVHLAADGIRVNAVSPGGIFNHQGEDFVRNYSYRCPLGRMAK